MITVDVPCFFVVKAVDEAAQIVASSISKGCAADITEVVLTSDDFSSDIGALLQMDAIINDTITGLHDVNINEQFNPLFLPQQLEKLDDMLQLQMRTDGVRFTGMDGNPFTIKLTNVRTDDSVLIVGKTQYHPFELPSYSEIVETNEHTAIN